MLRHNDLLLITMQFVPLFQIKYEHMIFRYLMAEEPHQQNMKL
jgi:hypothetical protein